MFFDWIEPDDFAGDPWGFAGNASGHIVIGIGAGLAVLLAGVSWLCAAPIAALIYWVVIERSQLRRFPRMFVDSFDDLALVWAGAAVIAAPSLVDQIIAYSIGVALLALGVWRRI